MVAHLVSRENQIIGQRVYLYSTQNLSDLRGHFHEFDGNNYFVVFANRAKEIIGKRVTPAGMILDSLGIVVISNKTLFGLAYDSLNYLVLTGDSSRVFITKMNSAGITGETLTLPPQSDHVETPAMTYGTGGISLIAYSCLNDSTCEKQIKTMIFNSHPTEIITNKTKKPDIGINIVNGVIKVTYTGTIMGTIRIAIFNPSGRIVRAFNTETGIGKQMISWDGVDNSGRAISNGCYIGRVEYEGKVIAKRFVLSR